MVIWSGFAGEKSASTSRLELVRVLSFLWVTTVSNRSDSRLEFGAFEGRGILGRRLADCEPNREMLPLPAFVPGGFMCSSKRFGAVPGRFRSGQVGGSEGRPRAGIASNCVVIVGLYLGVVNGTARLGSGSVSDLGVNQASVPIQLLKGDFNERVGTPIITATERG